MKKIIENYTYRILNILKKNCGNSNLINPTCLIINIFLLLAYILYMYVTKFYANMLLLHVHVCIVHVCNRWVLKNVNSIPTYLPINIRDKILQCKHNVSNYIVIKFLNHIHTYIQYLFFTDLADCCYWFRLFIQALHMLY